MHSFPDPVAAELGDDPVAVRLRDRYDRRADVSNASAIANDLDAPSTRRRSSPHL